MFSLVHSRPLPIPDQHLYLARIFKGKDETEGKECKIIEQEYTEEEQKNLNQLRTNVIALLAAPDALKVTEKDIPGGMHKHWTNWWSDCPDEALKEDNISKLDLDSTRWPDHMLMRFLKARDGNLKKASQLFYEYIRWRVTYGVGHIGSLQMMPWEPKIQTILAHSYHSYDKYGRPIYIQRSGLIDPDKFVNGMTIEQISIGHTYFTESMMKRCEIGSRKVGKRVTQIVNIIDVKGMGLHHRKTLKFFKSTSFIDQQFSPEMLGCLYMVNCPSFFPLVFALCKPFLSSNTLAKIKILGTNYAKTLVADLGAECLPKEYGGCCNQCDDCKDGCLMYVDKAKEDGENITVKAGHIQMVEIPVLRRNNKKVKDMKNITNGIANVHVSDTPHHDQQIVHSSFDDKESDKDDEEEGDIWWQFEIKAKDIEFSAEFHQTPNVHSSEAVDAIKAKQQQQQQQQQATDSQQQSIQDQDIAASTHAVDNTDPIHNNIVPTPPPVIVYAPTRLSHGQIHQGSWLPPSDAFGILYLKFSNQYAYWNSKTINVKHGRHKANANVQNTTNGNHQTATANNTATSTAQ